MSLKHLDLAGTITDRISIDEFEPKAGDTKDVIVVAFYLLDQAPADDLNTFIQRGPIDTLGVDVSPNTDDDGNYLVFVEMARDQTFPSKFRGLVRDIETVTGKQSWKVKTYLSDDQDFEYTDPAIYNYIIVDPTEYISKDEFMKESIKESVMSFLQNSAVEHLTFDGASVILGASGRKIVAEVVDVGGYDDVIGRNFLTEAAFSLINKPMEATVLSGILGNYDVLPLGKFLCVGSRDDGKVMLLKNAELKYRG